MEEMASRNGGGRLAALAVRESGQGNDQGHPLPVSFDLVPTCIG